MAKFVVYDSLEDMPADLLETFYEAGFTGDDLDCVIVTAGADAKYHAENLAAKLGRPSLYEIREIPDGAMAAVCHS